METILKTVNFAAIKHKLQKRKGDGSSYIVHPIGVAMILLNEGGINQVEVLQAAVLHDTVEDTNTTYEELVQNFGSKVADIVMEVTDDKSLSADERKRKQIEHTSHMSTESKLVKLADKLYNLRDLLVIPPQGWDVKRIQGYYVWAKKVIDGLRGTNSGLEAALDKVFGSHFTFDGVTHPVIPNVDLDQFLQEYYEMMSKK